MDVQIGLALADVQLLQCWHLLRRTMDKHPDEEAIVGAVESILTVLALRDGVIPPTLNLRNLDPEIDLDVVAGEPRVGDYRYALNNSFGFGGHNVAIAFGKY